MRGELAEIGLKLEQFMNGDCGGEGGDKYIGSIPPNTPNECLFMP